MLPRPRWFVKKRGTRRTGARWAGELAEGLISVGLIAAGAFGLYWLIYRVVSAQGAGWWPWFAMVIPIALFIYGVIGLVRMILHRSQRALIDARTFMSSSPQRSAFSLPITADGR